MPDPNDVQLPRDGWIALHQDRTVCLDWSIAGVTGAGMTPLIRFRDTAPQLVAECDEGGEILEWVQVSVMARNAAVRAGGAGAVRFIED